MDVVKIERRGERRILADIPWMNGQGKVMAKRIPGCAPLWDKSGPKDKWVGWTYPLDLETCRIMRQVFGGKLKIMPELMAWATAEVEREKRMLGLRSGDEEVGVLSGVASRAPKLAAALRPYQWQAVAFGMQGRSVLIADQPGLGKTLETLGTLAEAGSKAVIVFCRKSALTTVWQAEAERWLGEGCRVFVAMGLRAQREAIIGDFLTFSMAFPHLMCILVCNIEMVRAVKLCQGLGQEREGSSFRIVDQATRMQQADCEKHHVHPKGARFTVVPDYPSMHLAEYDAIVLDESHRALVGKSARSKNVTQTRLGMTHLRVRDGGLRIALSGTPFRGKNHASWGTLNWLRPDVFTSYWRFAEQYFEVTEGDFGGREVGEVRPDRIEDFDRMMAGYMLRRTKAECAPDLPPKMYAGTPIDAWDDASPVGIWLDMEEKQAAAYKAMEEDAEAVIDGGTLTAVGMLAEMTRLKQFASAYMRKTGGERVPAAPSNKLNWVLDFLESREGNDGKVLIFSQFTQLVEMFYDALTSTGYSCGMITGKTTDKMRAGLVTEFQQPDTTIQVMLLNTLAGGESITLDQADDVIFLDETSVPDEQEQAEDRAHRVSRQDHQVTIYYLRSKGTIEEDICRLSGAREGAVKARMDGSRGIEIMKARKR
jgi:SNF2 family DNA or RNA helicase